MAKKKEKKKVSEGIVHIKSTFNNTIVTVTDMNGNVINWASAGSCGFKNTKKGTPYAAQVAAERAIKEAINHGVKEVDIHVKGPGPGRETAIRAIIASGVKVRRIKDVTPIPHNGCRPKKKRRV
ncbi:MAG: 30S ribosomal protein S11 [Brevinematia bacterium]